MNVFCETWYCGLAFWFWYLFLSGHVYMYVTTGSLWYMNSYHPFDCLTVSTLLGFLSCFMYTTCLPMFYVLTRYERKEERIAVKIFAICIVIFLTGFASCLLLLFYQKPDVESYYMNMMKSVIRHFQELHDDEFSNWFYYIQQDYKCCGLKGKDDYTLITRKANITVPSTYTESFCPEKKPAVPTRRPCMNIIMEHVKSITTCNYTVLALVMAGTAVTAVFYAIAFVAIIEQPVVILTGKVYVRSSQEGVLKSFPEIDSEEAISVSSSD
jgi:hypothetical protein